MLCILATVLLTQGSKVEEVLCHALPLHKQQHRHTPHSAHELSYIGVNLGWQALVPGPLPLTDTCVVCTG